jgi:hypothetical protein
MDATSNPRVAIVIVTWNGRAHLERCLDALAVQTFRYFEVVVVDNASSDGTVEMLDARYPDVRLLRNEANLGFAPANNIGIRATTAPYVVTLNNDTIPDPGWLAALVDAADADPSVGSVASKMVFAHDPATINSCGIALDPAGIAWDLWGGRPSRLVDRPREVFGPCAGAALYRRAMLDDVGLFDDDFFAYSEDVDLAWRARLRGWRCVLAPTAVVQHAHSGTLGEGSPIKRFLLARNKVWVVTKCATDEHLRRWLPIVLLYDVGAATFGVLHQHDWASVRGRLAGLRALPKVLDKRRAIQRRRQVGGDALSGTLSPLAAPWDVPRRYRHLAGALGQREADRRLAPTAAGVPTMPPRAPASGSVRERARLWLLRGVGLLLPRPRTARPGPARATVQRPTVDGPQPAIMASQVRRIVVLRPDHLGDVLLSRPALEMLRAELPGAEITVVAGPWGEPSLRGIDARTVVFPFPGFTRASAANPLAPYGALLAFATRLRRERFGAALIVRPDHWWGALAAALAGIPVRVGHGTPTTMPFLTHAVPVASGPVHSTAAGLQAVTLLLGILATGGEKREPIDAGTAPDYCPSRRGHEEAAAWLRTAVGEARTLIAVHPGAGADIKSWPAPRWARLVEAVQDLGTVILTGGRGERWLTAAIESAAGRPIPALHGLSWDALGALYQRAALVVGMDSGPLHLGAAVGTPTVRIYGPTDPAVYGPAGSHDRHIVVQSGLPCAPCGNLVSPPCDYRLDPPCLASVAVEEVVAAARRLLPVASIP